MLGDRQSRVEQCLPLSLTHTDGCLTHFSSSATPQAEQDAKKAAKKAGGKKPVTAAAAAALNAKLMTANAGDWQALPNVPSFSLNVSPASILASLQSSTKKLS